MDQLLAPLFSFLLLYKYAALFVIIFVGNIVFLVPSNIFILMAGVFSGTAYFNFYWSLLIIMLANSAGDFVIYALTKQNSAWLGRHLRGRKAPYFKRLEKFMKSAAGRTIIISRITGAFSIVVNFLAGIAEISWWKFLFYDIIGNTLVAFILMYVGFVVGGTWEQASDTVNTVGLVVGVLMLAFFVYKAVVNNKK